MQKPSSERAWKSVMLSPISYEMLETALLQLVVREPEWETKARKFAVDNQLTRVVEHIDVMKNARRSAQLETPT